MKNTLPNFQILDSIEVDAKRVPRFILVFALLVVSSLASFGQGVLTNSATINYSGASGSGCGDVICGGNYACANGFGSWSPTRTFTDPSPAAANILVQVRVTYYGACSGSFSSYLNGQLIGSTTTSWGCCGGCNTTSFVTTNATVLGSYNWNGPNTITTNVTSGDLCLDRIVVTVNTISCSLPSAPSLSWAQNPVCNGSNATLNISGNLNNASQWTVLSGSCNGSTVANTSGSSVNLSQPYNPQYFVRGTGGCVSSVSVSSVSCTSIFAPTIDNVDPAANCQDITVNLSASGSASITASQINSGSTDNCSISSYSLNQTSFNCSNVGNNLVILTVTDNNGNTSSCGANVTVVDNQAPTINCPADIQVNAPNGNCAANVNFTTPTAADNCTGSTVTQILGPPSGSSFNVGDTIVSFLATDASGNTASCSFNVEVLDIEDPVITCPANINVLSTLSNCGANITYITPTATDNCSGVNTYFISGFQSGQNFPSGTTTVEYLAIDASGNQASCSFDVTVDPVPNGSLSIPPASVCQGDPITITFNFTSGTAPFNVSITDGVSTFNVSNLQNGDTYTVVPPTTVTYSFVSIQDATGCTRTTDFDGTASVVVTPIPIVSFSGLASVYCESDADVSLTGNQSGGSFTGTGINDLGGGSATFSPSGAGPTGPYDITYEYTDINGCTDSETQQVSVDEQPLADAGSGGSECDLNFTFSAVASVGTGTWTLISGPGLPLYSNINSPTSIVQVSTTGSYVFRWTEVNGECSDFDEVTVVFNEVPDANAGFGGAECDLNFALNAVPSVGTGTWTATGPGTAFYSPSANDPNATVTVDSYGTYTFTWTEDNNGCTDAASVQVVFDELPVADAGVGGDECDLDFTFSGSGTVGVGVWTHTGPGAATFNAANSPTATVTVSNYGTYTFTWTETNGNCASVDQVIVNFYEQPVADAGSGGDECDLDFVFSADPSVGSGVWTQLNGPGTSTFADDTDPASGVSVDAYGTYTYRWTETNGTCSDSETIVVNYYEQPVADAGVGGDECDLDFSLTGTASVGVGLWTASGPGLATFVNDLDPATDVSVAAYGTYTFTWTEINGTCSDVASVTVNFYEQPVAVAGAGGNECDLDFLLQAAPSVGTGEWSQNSGPGTGTFSNSTSPTTLVTVDSYGTYEFTWTETNGVCVDSRNTTVNFYEQPVADAGSGGDECDLDFALSANPSVGTGLWTSSGPGTAVFSDDADPSATVTVSQSGTYTFTWTETNGTCTDADDVVVNFYDQPVANAGVGGTECDLNFTFSGVASFGTGVWSYSGPGTAFFNNATNAATSVVVDTYGSYDFTWTETNGPCTDAATITVNFYQQPVADAGSGGSECDLDFDLDATPSVGNGTWTYLGPGTAVFAPSDSDPDATVTVDATGSYTFTWTEDNNGCTDSEDITVVFNPLPVVSFSGLAASYCIDQTSPVPLTGTPSGGTFSGLGISGNSFIPSVAGVGTIFVTYTYTDINGCTDSETLTTDVNGLPNVSFSGLDPEYCEDDANIYTLIGSPSGGTFSGLGISGDDFVPANAGDGNWTIQYEYTDPFGCTNSSGQQVVVNQLPVVSFTGLASSYCENASNVNLVGSPAGGTFSGNGIIGSAFSPVAAGVGNHQVTYTYTDGNGCTNSQTLQVTVNDVPVPVITPGGTSEICVGENLVLDAGSGYSVYNWSNNTNGQTTTVSSAGSYNVIVTTAAGCSGTSAPVQVVVNSLPVVDLGNDTTICTASVLTLDAGNQGADFSWSTFEITQTINVTTTGVYIVNVTDGNGCVGSDAISVTVSNLLDPVIVGSGPLVFCSGGSVTLDGGVFDSYLWSTGEQTQTITVSNPGVYELQVWDQFGCEGSDDEIVTVLQLPNAVITPEGPVEICEGDTFTLSASNNFSNYAWSPNGESTYSIQVYQAGAYSVTVEDPNNGCEATSNVVQVIVNTITPPFIVPSGPTEFCEGESVSLSVEPGPYTSILWSSGSTTPSIVVTQTGDYGVTVIDGNGCLDSTLVANATHIEVWDPQPIGIQQGDSVLVTNGPFNSYQWYLNGGPIPGATGVVYVPSQSGNYVCEVTDENGCTGTTYNIEFTFTGVDDVESLLRFDLYPNPSDGLFNLNVEFDRSTDVSMIVHDALGREVKLLGSITNTRGFKRQLDIRNMGAGVYYLNLNTTEGTIIKRLIVK
ncbi:MAG: HYR domain-containing protein [Flavobacteriales bacterium]|nr:HYR domain-containing protein [Flavobacteriales bacterium]